MGCLIHELQRTSCKAKSQCPEWSDRCPTTVAQILTFELDSEKNIIN